MRDKKHVFKRGLSLFLALTMCLSLLQVTAFAAEEHQHNWELINCGAGCAVLHTETFKCTICGETQTKKAVDGHSHSYEYVPFHDLQHTARCTMCIWSELRAHKYHVAATCTEPAKCICGKVEKGSEPLGHLYESDSPEYERNNEGHRRLCDREGCKEPQTQDFQPHVFKDGKCVCGAECTHADWEWKWDEQDGGTHWKQCQNVQCRHQFGNASHTNDEGTLSEDGTMTIYHCKDCGVETQRASVTEPVEPNPGECTHTYEWVTKTPSTCTKNGTTEYKCTRCGTVSATGTLSTSPHTYKQNGYHSWESIEGEDQHGKYCTVCEQYIGAAEHKWKPHFQKPSIPAACEKDGAKFFLCEICGATDQETIPALAHKYGEYTEKGTGHAKQCSVCGDYTPMEPHEYVDGVCVKCGAKKPVQPVEPYEHKWMWKDNKDGTHTFHCGLCGVDDADFVNEPHKFIGGECDKCGAKEPEQGGCKHNEKPLTKVLAKDATCTEDGVKEHYECSDCQALFVGTGTNPVEVNKEDLVITAPGHDMQVDEENSTTADCTQGGTIVKKCSRCGLTETEEIPQKGTHTYGDKIAEKPAACEVPGMKAHYECEVCGKLFIGTHEVSAEDLEIPALEHSFTHYVPDNNGSCTTAGTETAVCDNGCGKKDTRPAADSATGHTEVVDAAVAPTCTKTGLTEGRHCSVCGEVLVEQEVVEAAGHQYDDGVTIIVPDCNQAGATRFTCEVCGDIHEEADSPFGHEVVSYASVAATCTANGYTGGSYCSRCGSVITARTVVPAVGHSWNAGVVTTQPTYYNTGVRTYTCARDASHTYTETIPALTYPGGGGGGSYNPVTPVTPVTPNVPVTPNNPVNIPDANVPQGSTPDGLTTIEDENTPLGGITFVDVTPTDWFYDAVQYVFEKGLMLGVSDTEFGPNLSTTRGMIVTILYRMEGEPEAAAAPFTDVEPGLWYSDAIGWGAANDIVNGYGDGRFGPNDQITREQMAAIFYRYAQYKGYDVTARADLSGYADADQISEYAVEAMQWAVGVKLVNGLTADTLVPKGQATRAQVATMLMRFDQEIAAA